MAVINFTHLAILATPKNLAQFALTVLNVVKEMNAYRALQGL